ncbi:exodeoxyribonuclease V subunit gamma [Niveibacterium sp. SC-1]|uniref:exodeoxyribonuclease V subunit gamma n=1 Tax=Niveibacterium sp. SC-1 TaxID=3135646 RepID=UPI003120400C
MPRTTGFVVLHGNRLEYLAELVTEWLAHDPLAPLEEEVFLVQSNGIAQWLKMRLADPERGGIFSGTRIELPAAFAWRAYRTALGDGLPAQSPYDKNSLVWRLMAQLPALGTDPDFAPLADYLAVGDGDELRRFQLAQVLADLFDGYQIHRADWLADWSQNRLWLRHPHAAPTPLATDERWQARLWQALRAAQPAQLRESSRADVHRRFLAAAQAGGAWTDRLPPRIVLFGLSTLPGQVLEVLAALAPHCRVLVALLNPCRHYWADILPGAEAFAAQSRLAPKPGLPGLADPAELHAQVNPLLAAWGRQARDFQRLLDAHDQSAGLAAAAAARIDFFQSPGEATLLTQLQHGILELEAPANPPRRRAAEDDSLCFHVAHSPMREVEVLHDRLLALFDPLRRPRWARDLDPREVVVMVPDIQRYAPLVQAVFGQRGGLAGEERTGLPYSIADRGLRGFDPLPVALEALLRLDASRLPLSEIRSLLNVPALRARFGLAEEDLPGLLAWITQANIHWGLDAAQRQELGFAADDARYTWRFGLRRMLLGYATGGDSVWENVAPLASVAGLAAAAVGPLCALIDALADTAEALRTPQPPARWSAFFGTLLRRFFLTREAQDQRTLDAMQRAAEDWAVRCAEARFEAEIGIAVAREAWLQGLDGGGLAQRFFGSGITFCTLMPMRAIPFRVVCLLGMNDGDFPRSDRPADFDLMARPGAARPGDRARRDDDRSMMLEALLSARSHLHLSWVGRSVVDDSELPPSVLVAQLRDTLAAGWRASQDDRALLDEITVMHPLQPFSPRSFASDAQHFSYAAHWLPTLDAAAPRADEALADTGEDGATQRISLRELERFLRCPAESFLERRLGVRLGTQLDADEDNEPFALDTLTDWQLKDRLTRAHLHGEDAEALVGHLRQSGELPPGRIGEATLEEIGTLSEDLARSWEAQAARSEPLAQTLATRLQAGPLLLEHLHENLRCDDEGLLSLDWSVSALLDKKKLRPDRLLRAWIAQLLLAAEGQAVRSVLISHDAHAMLPPIDPDAARAQLQGLLEAWQAGHRQPLPTALRTGLAQCGREKDVVAAYEGKHQQEGELQRRAALARCFPDFTALSTHQAAGKDFVAWSETLYAGLLEWAAGARFPADPLEAA